MTVATDYNEKLAILEQAIENNPHDYQPWFEKSKILFELQRLDEALISIEKVLNICPDDLDVQLLKGEILTDRGEFEKALSYFENIIDQGSASSWILYLKGYSLQGLEYFEEAINVYKGIFESYPGQVNEALAVMIHLELGECLNQIKRHYEALAEYDKAILINPNDSTARYRRGTLLTFFIDDEGSSQRAIEDLDFVINNLIPEEEPHRIITYFIRAIAKNNSNDYIGAIEDFSIYLQYKPDEYSSYLYRSDAYSCIGEKGKAVSDLEKAADISFKVEDTDFYEKAKSRLENLLTYPKNIFPNYYSYLNQLNYRCLEYDKYKYDYEENKRLAIEAIEQDIRKIENEIPILESAIQLEKFTNPSIKSFDRKLPSEDCEELKHIVKLEYQLTSSKEALDKNKTKLDELKSANVKELILFLGIVIFSTLIFKHIIVAIIASIAVIIWRSEKYGEIVSKCKVY